MASTIFALSSGGLPAGVAMVRLSGPAALATAARLAPPPPPPRRATLRAIRDPENGRTIDRGLVLLLPGPASFTGEDVVEFHLHGGRAVVAALFDVFGREGLAPAEPGAFTRRAFANGRLDLAQAEALGDLVAAETEAQRRQALALADGALSRRARGWRETLLDLRAAVEADLDFSDEADVATHQSDAWRGALADLASDVAAALATADAGMRVRDGLRIAILGPPNAGKSSFLNALARRDAAIVTAEAGTTRDAIEVPLSLGGHAVVVIDTAGLREATSQAERIGVARATETGARADLVLWLTERGLPSPPPDLTEAPVWRVATKSDLGEPFTDADHAISTRTGTGLAALEAALSRFAEGPAIVPEAGVVANARQKAAVAALAASLAEASEASAPELVGEALRRGSDAIGRLTGAVGVEHVLDRIFARFCIGK